MIIQLSTGGRSGAGRERGGMLQLAPDMASLATGSCNLPTRVYENSPDLIDWLASDTNGFDGYSLGFSRGLIHDSLARGGFAPWEQR